MKRMILLTGILAFLTITNTSKAQLPDKQVDVSVDPIAFFLDGISVHGGYATNGWHFDVEGFSLDVPESVHGNEGLTASQNGLELKLNRYFQGKTKGFFVSAGGGISELKVTGSEGASKTNFEYSAGFRSGYRWNTGLGNLYLTPLVGLEYTFNPKDLTVGGQTFKNKPLQPYATVNIGWYFPFE